MLVHLGWQWGLVPGPLLWVLTFPLHLALDVGQAPCGLPVYDVPAGASLLTR